MAGTKTDAPTYAIGSVDSALKVLRMLCEMKRLRVSDVAARLDVVPSTAHRLLSMLVHHGFARQNERRGEYVVGPMFLEMGFAAIGDMEVRQHARPVLETLRDKVNETVHLGVPYGQNVFYVDGVESRHQLRVGSRVGTFVPAHCIGLGKALLATLARDELHHIYPSPILPALTESTVTTLSELERQLARVRRVGFSRSRAESTAGVGSLAVAVLDDRGIGRAAISISAPLTRINTDIEAQWAGHLQDAATKLRALVWSRGDTAAVVGQLAERDA